MSNIREKIATRRAVASGVDPVKYKAYRQAKAKELFIKQEEINRKSEEKLMVQKAELQNKAELEKLKARGGSSLLGGALKSYGQRLKANKGTYNSKGINQGSQGLNFGFTQQNKNKKGPFQL